jgi:copper transport protein
VARFSPFALGCVALAVVSGGVQAWRQLGSVDGLSTPYGRLLLAKLAPVVALVFAASLARRALRSWTADLRTPALLRRAVLGELAFGLVVLGVTSVLVATPPGRDRTAAPFVTSLVSPQGARAELSIEPAAPGPVTVHLYATPPGGSLERAAEARLTMSLPTRGIADLAVPLALAGNNHFASTGASIPLAGAWQATITVRFGEFDSYTFTTTVAVR